jgi:16S rRNA (guanine(966)-N(2))-methyltransferase RsmD
VRIIAGRVKGRKLLAPTGLDVRPTSDRLRETLFNVLGPTVDGARVLDAFAGTGALGLEAWSRGAGAVVFVERAPRALQALAKNIDACGAAEACAIIRGDFLAVRVAPPFDLVLLEPPYDIEDLPAVMDRAAGLVAPAGRIVLEHSRRRASPERAGGVLRYRVLIAGDSALSLYA